MKIGEIIKYPTVLDNVHESLYCSYHILDKVMEMLKRGDSKETIIEIVEFIYTKQQQK